MKAHVVALAAEFPNDNPAIHRGLSWICLGVTRGPSPVADALEHIEPAASDADRAETAEAIEAITTLAAGAAEAVPHVMEPAAAIEADEEEAGVDAVAVEAIEIDVAAVAVEAIEVDVAAVAVEAIEVDVAADAEVTKLEAGARETTALESMAVKATEFELIAATDATRLEAMDVERVPAARISEVVPRGAGSYDDEDEMADDYEEIVVEELPPLDETARIEGLGHVEPLEIGSSDLVAPRSPASSSKADLDVVDVRESGSRDPSGLSTAACSDRVTDVDAHACEPHVSTSTIAPPPPDDSFSVFLSALVDLAIGLGSPEAAALLPRLLAEQELDAAPSPSVRDALVEGGMIGSDAVVTQSFAAQCRAWRDILRGTSDDFGACGSAMLDEWAADLVARLLGAPSRATALRRDLRARGIAAFGLAIAA